MRQSCSIPFAVLFAALLSPEPAHCQGSTAVDPWAILDTKPGVLTDRINVGGNEATTPSGFFLADVAAGFGWDEYRRFRNRSDTGTFVDKLNGTAFREREVNIPPEEINDLVYSLTSKGARFGSGVGWRAPNGTWGSVGGSVNFGTLALSYVNPQNAETAYESPAGFTGFSAGGGAGTAFRQGGNAWAISGRFEYDRLQGDDAAQDPAQTINGARIASARNDISGHFAATSGGLSFWRQAGPVFLGFSGGAGGFWGDVQLDRQWTIDATQTVPGLTSEFTGRFEAEKHGAFGFFGARAVVKGGFCLYYDQWAGDKAGFRTGVTFLVGR
jgi:hypothetical protein